MVNASPQPAEGTYHYSLPPYGPGDAIRLDPNIAFSLNQQPPLRLNIIKFFDLLKILNEKYTIEELLSYFIKFFIGRNYKIVLTPPNNFYEKYHIKVKCEFNKKEQLIIKVLFMNKISNKFILMDISKKEIVNLDFTKYIRMFKFKDLKN